MALFDVLSPDGFPITFNKTYFSKPEANKALDKFVEKYKTQGYYSSNKGKIPFDKIKDNCKTVNA